MRYPKLRELKEAITALIKGPYTARFPYKPHKPFERFRGKPYFYEEDCVGCSACVQVCPSGALEFRDVNKNGRAIRILTYRTELCIFCGQCQANCLTEKGIMLSCEFDLATTEKRQDLKQEIEKELIACECCGEPIIPYEQYLWVVKKLGPLVFANPSLMLFYLRSLSLAMDIIPAQKKEMEFLRADRIKVLCPRCRREAVLKS